MSLVESIANVMIGYGIAVTTQVMVFPLFGIHVGLADNLRIGAAFTILCGDQHKMVYAEHIVMRSSMAVPRQQTVPEWIFWVACSA